MDIEKLKKELPDQAIITFAIPKQYVNTLDVILCDLKDELKHPNDKLIINQIIKAL